MRSEDQIETRDDILTRAFADAYGAAVAQLGDDRDSWRWGALHTATFPSTLPQIASASLIEPFIGRGPAATAGTINAINATQWPLGGGDFAVHTAPTARLLIDLSALDDSLMILSTGHSGHPYSPHYDDILTLWQDHNYHPLPWSRGAVEAASVSRLILNPAAANP
ncbi:MAG: penicillin acylase family protein [Chloroflexi bacterium]|nr:penicillin acylase family protein [Chloroflexota bacterium]